MHPLFGKDRKSTRLNSSHLVISYAVFCLKKKNEAVTASRQSAPTQLGRRGTFRGLLDLLGGRQRLRQLGAVAIECLFFVNETATTEIYTLSLHDALPI